MPTSVQGQNVSSAASSDFDDRTGGAPAHDRDVEGALVGESEAVNGYARPCREMWPVANIGCSTIDRGLRKKAAAEKAAH